jgi:hypothetical protein
MYLPFQPFILAIANRCRGGLITITSGQLARLLLWAIPLAATVAFSSAVFEYEIEICYVGALIVAAFGGACIAAWGKYDTIPTAWNPLMLTLQGLLYVGPVAVIAALLSFKLGAYLLIGGILIAPCYWLGWQIPSTLKGFERGIPIAELIYGAVLGLFTFLGSF